MIFAPGNKNESPLIRQAMEPLKSMAKSVGIILEETIMSLDGVYDCAANRKKIFNMGMIPNINPNKRNRKKTKRGRKAIFDPKIFQERFYTIERVFAWEDKFKRLLLRFETISGHHYGMKYIAYAMINLRYFCNA